jgi:ParB family chromosome partitioning protein
MGKKSLGRGLGDILGEVAEAYEKEIPQNSVVELPIEEIRTNPYQPRKQFDPAALEELAASIKEHGLLQPIVVIEDLDGYMLIAGERRLRASKMAGLRTIKAVVAKIDKSKFREFALIENIQREDLTPLELAHAYKELIEEYGITHEELADIVKKSRTHITNTLRLLKLDDYALKALEEGKISAGHAKVLAAMPPKEQKIMVDSIIGQNLSVREIEKLGKRKKREESLDISKAVEAVKNLGFRVKKSGAKITIEFTNGNELDKFVQIFEQKREL